MGERRYAAGPDSSQQPVTTPASSPVDRHNVIELAHQTEDSALAH